MSFSAARQLVRRGAPLLGAVALGLSGGALLTANSEPVRDAREGWRKFDLLSHKLQHHFLTNLRNESDMLLQ